MRIACAVLFMCLLGVRAAAEPLPVVEARRDVVVGMVGEPDEQVREVLSPLLRAELSGVGLALVERDPGGDLGGWAAAATRGRSTLLAVLLDTRGAGGWRLVIIDAARDRAIARELSGGMAENAASVEAVVSIVVSAANALREGLEVASTPTQSVVGSPAAPPPKPAPLAPKPPPPSPPRPASTFVFASLAATSASFSSDSPATLGPSAAFGVAFRSSLELRGAVSRHLPAHIASGLGEFRVDRSFAALSAGPALALGGLVLVPEAGAIVEWLERSETVAAAGVTGHADRTLHRVGGLLALRGRRRLVTPLALELRLGAAYFGQSVEFVAENAGQRRLTEAWPVVLLGELGLAVSIE